MPVFNKFTPEAKSTFSYRGAGVIVGAERWPCFPSLTFRGTGPTRERNSAIGTEFGKVQHRETRILGTEWPEWTQWTGRKPSQHGSLPPVTPAKGGPVNAHRRRPFGWTASVQRTKGVIHTARLAQPLEACVRGKAVRTIGAFKF